MADANPGAKPLNLGAAVDLGETVVVEPVDGLYRCPDCFYASRSLSMFIGHQRTAGQGTGRHQARPEAPDPAAEVECLKDALGRILGEIRCGGNLGGIERIQTIAEEALNGPTTTPTVARHT